MRNVKMLTIILGNFKGTDSEEYVSWWEELEVATDSVFIAISSAVQVKNTR